LRLIVWRLLRWQPAILITLLAVLIACKSELAEPTFSQSRALDSLEELATAAANDTVLRQPIGVTQESTSASPNVTVQPTASTVPPPDPTSNLGYIGPDTFPSNVNPLTGETVTDPAMLLRRPIAIKISNISSVRPQAGLNNAELVFELYSEGGITRLTAIFYSKDASRVGSIRSGRLIDLEIPLMYDAAFAYSGSSAPIRQMIQESIFFKRVISPDFAHGGFERILDEKNPSTKYVDSLFTDTNTLRWILEQRGLESQPILKNGMAFHPDPPPGGSLADKIEISYAATNVLWNYNWSTKRYARWSDGVIHQDANTDEQLSARNIVVIKAKHYNTEIAENTAGSPSIQIQIWNEDPAIIFRDGQRYDGFWRRTDPAHMITFYDAEGSILPLAPGNTFFEIVPLDFGGLDVQP
jgi:hypothetical protein